MGIGERLNTSGCTELTQEKYILCQLWSSLMGEKYAFVFKNSKNNQETRVHWAKDYEI